MAKRKRSGRPPQLQHGKKTTPSQHDKRNRLSCANLTRRKTDMASVPLVGGISIVVAAMQSLLHARIGFRLPIVMAGALLARGRRTASSWFRAAGVKDDWDRFYELLVSAGKAPIESIFRNDPSTRKAGSLSTMSVEVSPSFGTTKTSWQQQVSLMDQSE